MCAATNRRLPRYDSIQRKRTYQTAVARSMSRHQVTPERTSSVSLSLSLYLYLTLYLCISFYVFPVCPRCSVSAVLPSVWVRCLFVCLFVFCFFFGKEIHFRTRFFFSFQRPWCQRVRSSNKCSLLFTPRTTTDKEQQKKRNGRRSRRFLEISPKNVNRWRQRPRRRLGQTALDDVACF